jgi:hypothetical protein
MSTQFIVLQGSLIQTIAFDPIISQQNTVINTIAGEPDFSLINTQVFGDFTSNFTVYISLRSEFVVDLIIEPINKFANVIINDIVDYYTTSSISTFGDIVSIPIISPDELINSSIFGTYSLNQNIIDITRVSTLVFGTSIIDMEIDDPDDGPQLLPVVNIQQFGEIVVGKVIGALSINPTPVFGLPVFGGFVHRALIFKDDNIAKISPVDSVELVSNIVFNPSIFNTNTASSGTSTLPSNPVGYILITISGTNYKIPYYNE